MAEDSKEVSRELLSLGVIQHLLYAMGNREHTDAQIQASVALEVHTSFHIDMQYAQAHTRAHVFLAKDSPLFHMMISTQLV